MSDREIMLVGSVPLKPASAVFDCVCRHHMTANMRRLPDGEQAGWASGMTRHANNPALESFTSLPVTTRSTTFFDHPMPLFRLKPGHVASDVAIAPLGVLDSALNSYQEFKAFKAQGKFAPETRFVVTLAGPGTSFGTVLMPTHDLFPIIAKAFKQEIRQVLDRIPHADLAIQLDLAGEVEIEEYRRRPRDFDLPIFERTQDIWPFEGSTDLVADIAAVIPDDVELGFHLCALWHIDQSQGQDLNVHVDWANTLSRKITRPIQYIHMPTTFDYTEQDFAPLQRLTLKPGTRLFLGVVHAEDGAEGARRRVSAARKIYPDFGVAAFCGLAQPSREEYRHAHSVDEIMDMHVAAAKA